MDAAKLGYGTCTERFGNPYTAERAFWDFIDERRRIWKRRQDGCLPPWTEDKILQKYHFCNCYRELDVGTQWYTKFVVNDSVGFPDLLWRTIVYRLVNNWRQFEAIGGVYSQADWRRMLDSFKAKGITPYSPAYIILCCPIGPHRRIDRLAFVLEILERHFDSLVISIKAASSLEIVSAALQAQFGLGPFLALQIFRDLILARAIPFNDNDWTEIGPGCAWTLREVFGQHRPSSWPAAVKMLAARAEEALRTRETPLLRNLPPNLCDIENCLCEFGKYARFSQGRGRRRLYRHGGNIPSTQSALSI